MADIKLDQFDDDFGLFVEAGFVAAAQADEPSAKKLFYAAQELEPDSPAPQVGLGYVALNKLELKTAIEIFKEVLEKHPDHHLAMAFLGIAHFLKKTSREEGEKLIKKAMKESEDPSVINLCEVTLQWADKDLKSKKAPFFAGSGKKEEESEEDNKD